VDEKKWPMGGSRFESSELSEVSRSSLMRLIGVDHDSVRYYYSSVLSGQASFELYRHSTAGTSSTEL
jgi:hypothetical protein